jgi:soluble lytic murein transglycosylase-like protein
MQVDPKAWKLDETKLRTNKEYNVENGSKILKQLYTKYGDIETAIKAYNIGTGSIARNKRQDAGDRYWTKFKTELSKISD